MPAASAASFAAFQARRVEGLLDCAMSINSGERIDLIAVQLQGRREFGKRGVGRKHEGVAPRLQRRRLFVRNDFAGARRGGRPRTIRLFRRHFDSGRRATCKERA